MFTRVSCRYLAGLVRFPPTVCPKS